MSAQRDNALVLRQWEYSETSQTVALFTRDHGLVRGLAKGSRREKSSFAGGFEPLTRGELLWIEKPRSDLATLTEWDLQEVYWGARRSYKGHTAGLYLIDLVYHCVVPGDAQPELFDRITLALRTLTEPKAIEGAVLRGQWEVLAALGSTPRLASDDDPHDTGQAMGFDPSAGRFVEDPGAEGPTHIWRVRRETLALLRMLEAPDAEEPERPRAAAPADVRRASMLLSAFLAHTLSRDLPTRAAYFDGEALPFLAGEAGGGHTHRGLARRPPGG